MPPVRKKTRLSAPFMFAFRDANQARDARLPVGAADHHGEAVKAGRQSALAAITEPQLRSELARDLDLLMNTTNLASALDLSEAQEVTRSILNFGLPDVIHMTIDENRSATIADSMAEAITLFEPRLVRDSVRVVRDPAADAGTLAIRFNVSAEMICDPVALPVEFIADLEVASGRLAVRKR